jgi:hypothetical protein
LISLSFTRMRSRRVLRLRRNLPLRERLQMKVKRNFEAEGLGGAMASSRRY